MAPNGVGNKIETKNLDLQTNIYSTLTNQTSDFYFQFGFELLFVEKQN